MPWFQGDGAHYLYLSGQDQTQAFGVDYFTTVSPYGLAGVTAPVETRRTIPELYGTPWYDNPGTPDFTSSSESQNTYVYFPRGTERALRRRQPRRVRRGRAWCSPATSPYAAKQAGCCPTTSSSTATPTATKSWFMLDEEIVVLAAGVGDSAGRAVTTTVDSPDRRAADDRHAHRDGSATAGLVRRGHRRPGLAAVRQRHPGHRRRLRLPGHARRSGVALDDGHPQPPGRPHRRTRTPCVTKQVFGVTVDQAAGGRTPAPGLRAGAERGRGAAGLVRRTGRCRSWPTPPRLQAGPHTGLGLTAANTFAPGHHQAAGLRIDGPASVIVQRGGHARHRPRSRCPTRRRAGTRSRCRARPRRCGRSRRTTGCG